MRNIAMIFLFVFCWSCPCRDLFCLDINEAVHQRTQQYDSRGYNKIIIYTPPRTGSTFLYNVFRFLFENQRSLNDLHGKNLTNKKVFKTHLLNKTLTSQPSSLTVFSIRNPMDCCLSSYKFCNPNHNQAPFQIDTKILHTEMNIQIKIWKSFDFVKQYNHILLRYEDFNENIDDLIKSIESFFCITINPIDINLIKESLSKEGISSFIGKIGDCVKADNISGFHWNHITPQSTNEAMDELVRCEIYKMLLPHSNMFLDFGYFLTDPSNPSF